MIESGTLRTLQARFEKHPARHKSVTWAQVRARLDAAAPATLKSLAAMEASGGEPDVIALGATLMRPYIEELAKVAGDTYVSCYPNAGLPNPMSDTGFDETPEITGSLVEEFAKAGFLNIAGGCCGTTPAHIAEIARRVGTYQPRCRHEAMFSDLLAA